MITTKPFSQLADPYFACPVFLFPSTRLSCLPGLCKNGLTPLLSFLVGGEGINDGMKLL